MNPLFNFHRCLRLSLVLIVTSSLITSPLYAQNLATPASNTFDDTAKASQQFQSQAPLPSQQHAFYEEAQKFLMQMGFRDYSAMAQATLDGGSSDSVSSGASESIGASGSSRSSPGDSEKNIHDVSRVALEKNANTLKSLNGVRNIASFVYAQLFILEQLPASQMSRGIEIAIEMAKQQLLPFPLISTDKVDRRHFNGKDAKGITESKTKLLIERSKVRFLEEKTNLLKALAFLSGVKELGWLDENLSLALRDAYTIQTHQQNRYLGRALVLVLTKFARERHLSFIEDQLRTKLLSQGLFLDNYIKAQYARIDAVRNNFITQVKSGDFVFEFSHGQEAFFTSFLIRPTDSDSKSLARHYDLVSRFFDIPYFLDINKYYSAIDKKVAEQPLSPGEVRTYDNYWDTRKAKGFSHVGIAEVLTDASTQLSTIWIWDVFPDTDQIGFVRVMTPEGFATPEKHLKIGFLRYDAEKVFAAFQEQIKTRGYLKEVWKGFGSFVGKYANGTYGPSRDDSENYSWPTQVSEAQVNRWASLDPKNAQRWYDNTIIPRVLARIKQYAVGKDAVVFAGGLISARSMAYCSQMLVLAFLEVANFDLQEKPDQVMATIRKLRDLNLLKYVNSSASNVLSMNLNHRIVSPNGLIWQDKIFGKIDIMFLNRERQLNMDPKRDRTPESIIYTNMLTRFPEVLNQSVDEKAITGLDQVKLEVIDFEN